MRRLRLASSSSSLERRAVAAALAQGPQRALALRARRPVEDQDAVEVVDLVLEDPRLEAGGLDHDRLAVDVEAADAGVQRPLDVHRDPRQAEAALLGDDDLVGEPLDLGVDERGRLAVGAGLEDEQAAQDAELGGGEADAHAVAHDRDHPLDLGAQLGAELGHLRGLALQHRIAELDARARAPPRGAPAAPLRARSRSRSLGLRSAAHRSSNPSLWIDGERPHCGSTSTADRDLAQGAVGGQPLDRGADRGDGRLALARP